MRFHSRLFAWFASLALSLSLTVISSAAVVTWDGDTSSDIFDPNNWVGGVGPTVPSPDPADELVFPGSLAPGASLTPTVTLAEQWFTSITFEAGAPQYRFTSNSIRYELYKPGGTVILNNSTTAQVIDNVGLGIGADGAWMSGFIDAAAGDIVVNAPIRVAAGSTSSSLWLGVNGANDVYFNVDPAIHPQGSLAGGAWTSATASNMYSRTRGRFFMDTFSGTAYLGDIGTAYQGTFHLNSNANGALRLTHNNSLGSTANNSAVVIWGGNSDVDPFASNATLEFDGSAAGGGITVERPIIYVDGRSGAIADDPHLLNVNGNNTFIVSGDWNTGHVGAGSDGSNAGNINLQSDTGKLTITGGPVYTTQNPGGDWFLVLRGAGDGEISSQVTMYQDNPSWHVVKKGTGTWTLSNTNNDYNGPTTVEAGTLSLGSTGTLVQSSTINVRSGATLDVSAQAGLSLGTIAPQTLKGDGTVSGNVTLGGGSTLAVDFSGGVIESLSITGALDITGATIDFNDLGGGLAGGAHVFATYGSLIGEVFSNMIDLPIGYTIDYDYQGIQIALVASAVPGDFDNDGDVDGADFVVWQTNFPTATGANLATGDADGDGDVDGADFVVWQTNFPTTPGGAVAPVPEPMSWALLAIGGVGLVATRMRLRRKNLQGR